MVQIRNITYEIGQRRLLSDISWNINDGSRVALIGKNGSGKTTVLRIITGDIQPTSGTIIKSSDHKTGYLPQEEIELENTEILQMVLTGKDNVLSIENELESIQNQLQNLTDKSNLHFLIQRRDSLENQYRIHGGFSFRAEAKKILAGIGFNPEDFTRKIHEFSGGWRMRVYLAKLLLQTPDLLLLDEPTNHLDLPSLEWLENYLKKYKGSLVIVSHDRFFIDRIGEEIVELNEGTLQHFPGNFQEYEKKKQMLAEMQENRWKNQQKYREQQQKFIDRFRYKATKAAQVQSRIKRLEKLDDIKLPQPQRHLSFELKVSTPSYKDVISFKDVSFRYGTNQVLESLTFQISRGDRIALIGKNGAGKSTLTKLMAGLLEPQSGQILRGQRVSVGYFAQHRMEELSPDLTIYEEVLITASESNRNDVRSILGLFGFSGDDIEKKNSVLSGGEKARVSVAKILLSPVNFLIMDEPTNHLDIDSRRALEAALSGFDGTLLLISHDRYFLDKLVHRVYSIEKKRLKIFEGNYSEYLASWENLKETTDTEYARAEEHDSGQKSKDRKRKEAEARQAVSRQRNQLAAEIENIEQEIRDKERLKSDLEYEMSLPDTHRNSEKIIRHQKTYNEISHLLKELEKKWLDVSQRYEKLMQSLEESIRK